MKRLLCPLTAAVLVCVCMCVCVYVKDTRVGRQCKFTAVEKGAREQNAKAKKPSTKIRASFLVGN